MDTYDLEVAFFNKLAALSFTGKTLKPDEIFDPKELTSDTLVRRGVVLGPYPETVGFRHGAYTRAKGIYQIDLWVPRQLTSAMKTLKQQADAHVVHFFPANGRGLTLTENSTSANMDRYPEHRFMGREGAYLREVIEVDFFVDVDPSA